MADWVPIALVAAGMLLVIFVFVTVTVFVAGLVYDALRAPRPRRRYLRERPTLNVQNQVGDPNDPTAGAH